MTVPSFAPLLAAVLAQLPTRPAPPPIPDPPWLEHALLESPWTVAIALFVCGLAAGYTLFKGGRSRLAWAAALVPCLLSAGVLSLAAAITTDRELAQARAEALIRAVARADAPAVSELLSPRLTVRLVGVLTSWSKDDVVERVQRDMAGRYALHNRAATIRSARASGPDGGVIRTQCRVIVEPEATRFPTGSWWLLTWRQDSSGQWRVSELELQQVDGLPDGVRID